MALASLGWEGANTALWEGKEGSELALCAATNWLDWWKVDPTLSSRRSFSNKVQESTLDTPLHVEPKVLMAHGLCVFSPRYLWKGAPGQESFRTSTQVLL